VGTEAREEQLAPEEMAEPVRRVHFTAVELVPDLEVLRVNPGAWDLRELLAPQGKLSITEPTRLHRCE
jgi:hypothetical protein